VIMMGFGKDLKKTPSSVKGVLVVLFCIALLTSIYLVWQAYTPKTAAGLAYGTDSALIPQPTDETPWIEMEDQGQIPPEGCRGEDGWDSDCDGNEDAYDPCPFDPQNGVDCRKS
jgi:hypothetical protein